MSETVKIPIIGGSEHGVVLYLDEEDVLKPSFPTIREAESGDAYYLNTIKVNNVSYYFYLHLYPDDIAKGFLP